MILFSRCLSLVNGVSSILQRDRLTDFYLNTNKSINLSTFSIKLLKGALALGTSKTRSPFWLMNSVSTFVMGPELSFSGRYPLLWNQSLMFSTFLSDGSGSDRSCRCVRMNLSAICHHLQSRSRAFGNAYHTRPAPFWASPRSASLRVATLSCLRHISMSGSCTYASRVE